MSDADDVIDATAGLAPGLPIAELRRQRPDLRRLSQTSYDAALRPKEPRSFSYAERAARGARMARLWRDEALERHYLDRLAAEGAGALIAAYADPATGPDLGPRAAAVLRHVDLVPLTPEKAPRADVAALLAAGLDDRDVVTLAGLIAFVNYQLRVVAGLRMLKGGP